ncbi:MAG: TMEM14 family protein [Nodularia sp. CChRGM 3473]
MNTGAVTAVIYGVLMLSGGIFGYIKAKSKISLVSGIASGLLLILGGVLQLQGIEAGLFLALIVGLALIIVFGIRLIKNPKFMPVGLIFLIEIIALSVMLLSAISSFDGYRIS